MTRRTSVIAASFAMCAFLAPVVCSAQEQPSNFLLADEQYLASIGSFIVHLFGNIHIQKGVTLGSFTQSTPLNTLSPGSGWSAPTAQPAQQGTALQQGYYDDVIAQWDPGESVPYSLVTSTQSICVLAYEASGIKSVQIGIDGNYTNATFTNQTSASNGANATYGEYCVKLNPAVLVDGEHELRAIVTPNAGIPRVLQSGAVVSVTNGNPLLFTGPNGVLPNKQIISATSADGFTAGTLYEVSGGYTANTYALSPVSLLTTSGHAYTPYSASIAVGSPTTVTQTNSYAAGQAIMFQLTSGGLGFHLQTGLTVDTPYYVCATGLTSSSYELSSTQANAVSGICDISTSGSASGTVLAWPVVTPTGSGPVTLYYANAFGLEVQSTMGESLFLQTNSNGGIHTYTQYVDTSGTDPGTTSRTSCTTSGAPCATLHGALANIVTAGGTVTESSGTHNSSCAMFTHTNHGFVGGDIVVLSGTLGSGFTLQNGSTGIAGNQDYYVLNNSDLTTNTFEISANPGGSCIPTGGTYSGISAAPDASDSTIYLMCDGICTMPSQYTLGAVTENFARNAISGYLNLLPAPGFSHSNVELTSAGSSNGLRVNKLHVGVDIAPQTISLTTNSDSPAGTGLNFLSTSGLSTGMLILNGAGCASDGYYNATYMYGNAITSLTGSTVSLNANNFADCPSGTQITFENSWGLVSGYHVWLDNMSDNGPGAWTGNTYTAGSGSSWYGGIYATDVAESQHGYGMASMTYIWNSTASHTGFVSFNAVSDLVASSADHNGTDYKYLPVTTNSGLTSGSPTLSFALGTIPTQIRTGMLLSASCGIPANAYVKGYNLSAGTITMSANASANCSAETITFDTGWHPDWQFDAGLGNNITIVNNAGYNNVTGEGMFQQTGPFYDTAYVGNKVSFLNGFYAVLLETPLTNGYFANNTFLQTSDTINFRTDIAFSANDVYFINNSCAQTSAISNAAVGVPNVTVSGGSCSSN